MRDATGEAAYQLLAAGQLACWTAAVKLSTSVRSQFVLAACNGLMHLRLVKVLFALVFVTVTPSAPAIIMASIIGC